jgi:hypothetical protein
MKNYRIFSILAFLLFVTLVARGQTNFTGTWALNEAKCTFPENGFRMSSPAVTITQDANSFSIEKTLVTRNGEEIKISEKYTLDGKESINPMFNSQKRSTAAWSTDKKVLTVSSVMVMEFNGVSNEIKQVDIYKLTADNVLSLDTQSTSSMGEFKSGLVYDKK